MQSDLIFNKTNRNRLRENELRLPEGRGGAGRMDWEFGIDMHTVLYIENKCLKKG